MQAHPPRGEKGLKKQKTWIKLSLLTDHEKETVDLGGNLARGLGGTPAANKKNKNRIVKVWPGADIKSEVKTCKLKSRESCVVMDVSSNDVPGRGSLLVVEWSCVNIASYSKN